MHELSEIPRKLVNFYNTQFPLGFHGRSLLLHNIKITFQLFSTKASLKPSVLGHVTDVTESSYG